MYWLPCSWRDSSPAARPAAKPPNFVRMPPPDAHVGSIVPSRGLWEPEQKRRRHHRRSERKEYFGEMMQLDGNFSPTGGRARTRHLHSPH